jgi:predicted  nucleic acid-binding Zn-ribbon protein
MIERLKTLARMQKLDDEIGRCKELQNVLPRQLNNLIEDVEAALGKVLEIEAVRQGIQKKQKDLEIDFKHNLDLKRKYDGQLAEIKTNKEYKALNSEIAKLNAKNSDIEFMQLELMETETEINNQLSQEKEKLQAAEQRKREKESDLRTQIAALEGKIDEVRAQRNELARTLPVPLVKQYGALIKNKNNQAVAYNNNGACGGCGFIIRPQIRIELELLKKVLSCENCGRILMVRFEDLSE